MKMKNLYIYFSVLFVSISTNNLNAQDISVTGDNSSAPINASQLVESNAYVSDNGIIGTDYEIDEVTIDISHSYNQDMKISLLSPNGTTLSLSLNNGGDSNDYSNTIFSDYGTNINFATGPFSGTYQPEGGTFASSFDGASVNGDWKLQIDDEFPTFNGTFHSFQITFNFIGCNTPTNIASNNITATQADLSWDTVTGDTYGYEYVVMAAGDAPNLSSALVAGTTVSGDGNVQLTGLNAQTVYDYYVRTECGTKKSEWSTAHSLTTSCAVASIPYIEDFENGFDTCWERDNASTSFISSDCRENQGSFLQLNGGTHTTTTNTIDVSGESSIDISWDIYNGCNNDAESGENLVVDYWDGTSWQNIVTYDPANLGDKWNLKLFTLTNGLTADFKVRFVRPAGTGSGPNADDIDIDNFEVKATPVCSTADIPYLEDFESGELDDCWFQSNSFQSQILNNCSSNSSSYLHLKGGVHYAETKEIDVTNTCENSIDVKFDLYNGCDEPAEEGELLNVQYWDGNTWQLIFSYDPANLSAGWSAEKHTITSGLSSYFKVRFERPAGNGSGYKVDDINIDNLEVVESTLTIPYEEDFENGLSCWDRNNPSASFIGSNCGDNSSSFLQLNGGFHSTRSKNIDVSGESSIDVSWEIFNGCNNASEAGENLEVDYWDGTTWQNIVTYDPSTDLEDTWLFKRYTITDGLTSDFKLRFSRPDNTGSGVNADDISLDNIKIISTPDCNFPLKPEVTTITSTTVHFIWDPEVSASEGYEYILMASGISPDLSSSVDSGSNASSLPVNSLTNANFTQLNPSTSYDIYVRSKCGPSEFSEWSKVESFETDCPATSLPFIEDFESGFDACWSRTETGQSFIASNCGGVNGDYLQLKGGFHTTETNTIDVSNTDDIDISFSIYNGCDEPAEAGENLVVEYWNDSEWQNLETFDPANLSANWEEQSYTIDASNIDNFKLRYIRPDGTGSGANADDINIDDLEIKQNLNNPDFYVENSTCKCPDASIGEIGQVTIDGQQKVFTKRTRAQLDALLSADINDSQIALTCTSGITDMSNLFKNSDFNQNINSWDVSTVTNMRGMFALTDVFNQPLNNWDVSNVINMSEMFMQANDFNQSLNSWDVSNVENMEQMFRTALAFNQQLNNWDLSNASNLNFMFLQAQSFNQDISGWCTPKIYYEPINFSNSSPLQDSFKPDWSACNNFYLAPNNATCMCPDAEIGETGIISIDGEAKFFTKRTRAQLDALIAADINDPEIALTCTSGITDMSNLFEGTDFSQNINSWDVSNVTTMNSMFKNVSISFNQPLDNWNTSNVTDMSYMFHFAYTFDQNINSWDVSNVTNMNSMFYRTAAFNQALDNWDVSNVTNMQTMFQQSAFNQPINNWNVSSVTSMAYMFALAQSFNQPLNDWDVSNLTNADFMFANAFAFNQDLSSWCVEQISNEPTNFSAGSPLSANHKPIWGTCGFYVENNTCKCTHADIGGSGQVIINGQQKTFTKRTRGQLDALIAADINDPQIALTCTSGITDMSRLFYETGQNTDFNQNINSWDVSNVTDMRSMFRRNIFFDQPLSNWDVSDVTDMSFMFDEAKAFNKNINSWDVSNVTNMERMFDKAEFFNQPLNDWNVSNVDDMGYMFFDAYLFNQALDNWDVSNVTYMGFMFYDAQSFDQDLSGWCVGQLNFAPSGFSVNSPLSVDHEPNWGNPCDMITWTNNSWNNGMPDGNDSVIIDDNYNQNSLADVKELTVNAGKILNIYDKLKVKSNLENNGQIIFKNNAQDLGQFDTFTGSITGNGDITVERFIPVQSEGTRAFRFLTSAVNSSGSIYDNWQEGGNSPAGFGTHITGNNNGSNGVDQTFTGNPSMYTFDNTFTGNQSNAWEPVLDTKANSLQAGKAYRIFIRGDRNYDLSSSPAYTPNSDVTLRATGDLAFGDQIYNLSNVAGYYNLIGNPYQSIVNMNELVTNNVNTNFYWIWDPNMNTRGAYVTVELPSGDPIGTSLANEFVQPGQSFFVQTTNNGSADITFKESAKDLSPSPTTVFSDDQLMRLNLLLYTSDAYQDNEREADALIITFSDNASNAVDQFDAGKLGNLDENLARFNNGDFLSIEKRSTPIDNESLELFVNGFTENDYVFVANLNHIQDGVIAYLTDNYTGNKTLLSNGENLVNFSVDQSLPQSIASDRFMIDLEIETFSISGNEFANTIQVYPNPVENDLLTIDSQKMAGKEVILKLYTILGQQVMHSQEKFDGNGKMELALKGQQSGVYIMEIEHNESQFQKRIIIK